MAIFSFCHNSMESYNIFKEGKVREIIMVNIIIIILFCHYLQAPIDDVRKYNNKQ